jgi:hypothetical protein
MRESDATSVKFSIPSAADPAVQTRVLVSLAHVVRLVPYYYDDSSGRRMITAVEGELRQAAAQGLKRSFYVYDALGGQYDGATASPSGQSLLERMWEQSA